MNRRTFIRLAAASAFALEWLPFVAEASAGPSKVVRIRNRAMAKGGRADSISLKKMVDRAVCLLTAREDAREAWSSLFSPHDTIGIKVNCLAGRGLSSHPPLVDAIASSLHEIGIKKKEIIVWDRSDQDLGKAGFRPGSRSDLYRCFGTDQVGFSEDLYENGSVGSLVSSILTKMCSAIINVPVLKDHGITGVSIALKNYFGAIHNPNKYHPDGGTPYIADLNAMDIIRKKERLVVCDGIRVQYHGGPALAPRWNRADGSILVADDPVALDYVGFRMIEKMREQAGMPSLEEEKRYPRYIFYAAERYGMGNASDDKIELVREEV